MELDDQDGRLELKTQAVDDDEPGLRKHLEAQMALDREVDALRERIPSFRCIVGCHDCCGPVTASASEVARLPVRTSAQHAAAMENLSCVYLGAQGCQVYEERPLICRLYGTTPRLACPNGRRPVYLIDTRTEDEIHRLLARTRQVLL